MNEERLIELLAITAARLNTEQLARAESCFLTDEPYVRLFLGETAYFDQPAETQCVSQAAE